MTNHDPQEDTMDNTDDLTWATARTLDQLGELTARWLEGTVAEHANGHDVPDEETAPLVPTLIAINRAGVFTDFSQPGQPWDDGSAQRAALTGWCNEETRSRLAAVIGPTELILLAEQGVSGVQIPVTYDVGEPFTWVGGALDADYLPDSYPEVHPDGIAAMAVNWHVTVIDPVWGRSDLLWPTVATALGITT